jgi:hypothetical protein
VLAQSLGTEINVWLSATATAAAAATIDPTCGKKKVSSGSIKAPKSSGVYKQPLSLAALLHSACHMTASNDVEVQLENYPCVNAAVIAR